MFLLFMFSVMVLATEVKLYVGSKSRVNQANVMYRALKYFIVRTLRIVSCLKKVSQTSDSHPSAVGYRSKPLPFDFGWGCHDRNFEDVRQGWASHVLRTPSNSKQDQSSSP